MSRGAESLTRVQKNTNLIYRNDETKIVHIKTALPKAYTIHA